MRALGVSWAFAPGSGARFGSKLCPVKHACGPSRHQVPQAGRAQPWAPAPERSIFAAGAVECFRKTFEALKKGVIETHGLLVQTFVFVWVCIS